MRSAGQHGLCTGRLALIVNRLHHNPWWGLAAVLGLIACLQPVALYLCALAVFGLPHVVWEMAWVRRVWAGRLPSAFWCCTVLALLIQASARSLLWLGRMDAATTAACDVATLGLAVLGTLWLMPMLLRPRRFVLGLVALLLPFALLAVADTPYVMGVLAGLAIAHNFSPLGLVPPHARIGQHAARNVMGLLFLCPVLLFAMRWIWGVATNSELTAAPGELLWLQGVDPSLAQALLPALVWAQCLHYLCVLILMPRTLGHRWSAASWRPLALLVSALLLAGFCVDYGAARSLYSIAAGMHAWLEWPLILLALCGPTFSDRARVL